MKIDWFTFAAQMINFLVLVALLQWLLYGPIVRAMKKREEKIAGRLEQASWKREEAEERSRSTRGNPVNSIRSETNCSMKLDTKLTKNNSGY